MFLHMSCNGSSADQSSQAHLFVAAVEPVVLVHLLMLFKLIPRLIHLHTADTLDINAFAENMTLVAILNFVQHSLGFLRRHILDLLTVTRWLSQGPFPGLRL